MVSDDPETEAFASGIAAFVGVAIALSFWFLIAFETLLLLLFSIITVVVAASCLVFYRDTPTRAERNARRMKLSKKLQKEKEKRRKKELKQQEKERKHATDQIEFVS